MPIKISYKKTITDKIIKIFVLFAEEGFRGHVLNNTPLANSCSFVNEIIK